MNIGAALTKKLGPLPAWGWGVLIGAAGLGYKMLKGGGGGSNNQPVQQLIPTGPMQIDPSAGFLNELSAAIDKMRGQLNDLTEKAKEAVATPKPKPADGSTDPIKDPPPKTPQPISAKPATLLSRADAAAIVKRYGLDPAKVFGYGTSAPKDSFWVNNPAANYVWKSASTFETWLKRAYNK